MAVDPDLGHGAAAIDGADRRPSVIGLFVSLNWVYGNTEWICTLIVLGWSMSVMEDSVPTSVGSWLKIKAR